MGNRVNRVIRAEKNEINEPITRYNVVFIDTVYGSLARQTVNIFTRDNVKEKNGWICGEVPHLKGATFWAPIQEKLNYDALMTFLKTLDGPIRLMVCTPYGDRFESNHTNIIEFKKIYELFGVDLVIIGGPPWRGNVNQLYSELVHWGHGIIICIAEELKGPSTEICMCYRWGGGTTSYYAQLPKAGQKLLSSEVSMLLNSFRENNGIILGDKMILK